MRKRRLNQNAQRGERRTCRHGVGGVGGDQQRRVVAAPDRALEAARDLHAEQDLARGQELVELGNRMHFPDETEIGRVFQRLQDRTSEITVLLQQHRGRQLAGRGVDGVTEQQKLHHRNHNDHRERYAIALKLNELLHHHRKAAPEKAEARFPDFD